MILVVGGAGYIGSHTNKLLNQRGFKTVVFDNLVFGHRNFVKWGEFVLGDLNDKKQIRLCFEKYPIKAVMHFSAFAFVGESITDPYKYYQNNVVGTLNLLAVMKEFNVKHFIFSSTCATYGVPEKIPITEDHVQNPINPYGKSKLMIETILKDFDDAYNMKHVNLRYFNAAGADPDAEIGEWHTPETHLIPLILDVATGERENIKIFGTDYNTSDGTCVRDYIHVNDLASAHILVFEYLLSGGKSDSFNLGNGEGYSVKEVIEMARNITGKDIPVINWERRPGDPPNLVGSADKIKKTLGWEPKYAELNTIIKTAWNWHSSSRDVSRSL